MATKFIPITIQLNLGNAQAQLSKLGGQLSGFGSKLSGFGQSSSLFVTAPLTAFGGAAIKAATDLDSLKRGLTAVTGSSAETEQQLLRLKEVAKLPGLGFQEAVRGSINLQAAGLSAQLAERSLGAFGNALATVGRGKADLDGVILALGQIESKGKVSAEEINQLAERVPQIRKAIIGAFGTADTEVLQRAKITSRQFTEAIVRELEKLPKATGGAQNSFENLSDTAQQSLEKIGTPILRTVIPLIDRLIPKVEEAANSFAKLDTKTQDTLLALGGVALAAGPVLGVLGKLAGFLGGAAKAAGSLAGAIASIPAALRLLSGVTGTGILTLGAGGASIGTALLQQGDVTPTARRQRDEGDARAREAQLQASAGLRANVFGRLGNGGPRTFTDELQSFALEKQRQEAAAEVARKQAEADKLRQQVENAGKSKGAGKSKAETELERLTKQVKELNSELSILSRQTSDEFKLQLQVAGLTEGKSQIEDLLKLQREAGLKADIPQIDFNTGKFGIKKIFDFARIAEQSGRLQGDFGIQQVDFGGINDQRGLNLSIQEGILEQRGKVLDEQKKVADNLIESTADLKEQIAALKDPTEAGRVTRDLLRQNIGLDNPEAQARLQAAQELDQVREQIKAQDEYEKALEDSRRATERFASQLRNTFEDVLGSLLRGDVKGAGNLLKNFGANLGQQILGNALFGSGQTGAASSGGGGGFLSSILGGGQGGGGLLGGLLRTPGFNPAASSPGTGGGGILSILGGGGGGGGLGSGAVAASTGGAGTFGAGLGALFSNPITAVIAGAAIGSFFLYKFLKRGQFSKDVRKAIKSEYGVDVKSKDVLKQIEEIAKSRYGKDYKKRASEVVRLPEVRDIVAQYAEDTGQKGNAKLFNQADFSDQFSSPNFFKSVDPINNFSAPSAGSQGFVQTSSSSGPGGLNIVQAAQIGTNNRLAAAIEMFVDKFGPVNGGDLIAAHAGAVGEAFKEAFSNDPGISQQIGLSVNP